MEWSTSCHGIIHCDSRWVVTWGNSSASHLLKRADLVGKSLAEQGLGPFLLTQPAGACDTPYSRYIAYPSADGSTEAFLVNVASSGSDRIVTFEPAEWSLSMWSQLDAVVLATDEAGRVVFVHAGDPRLPTVPPQMLLGRHVGDVSLDFVPTSGISASQIAEVMSGKPARARCDLPLPDGRVHSISVRQLPWRYCGCGCGVLVVVTDVTHPSDAVAQNSRAMMFRLWRAFQHELRNPLQTMQAAVELLRPQVGKSGQRPLQLLSEQIEAVDAYLTDQILVGLPAAGAVSLGRLSDVVSREIERASIRLFTGKLRFVHRPPADEPVVRLWGEAMGRVFANLFRNTAQARADANVDITYVVQHAHVLCTVADDGPGYPPMILGTDWDQWIEPAQHLGLTLAASTLHAHGGTMALRNRDRGGALAEIVLPRAHAVEPSQRPEERQAVGGFDG